MTLKAIKEKLHKTVENIYQTIDKNKKTVAFASYSLNYRNHVGSLHKKFKEAGFNVINIVECKINDRFEKEAPTFIIPKYLIVGNKRLEVDIDIDFIDLIITPDVKTFEGERLNKNFISKKAKKIFLPHEILHGFYKTYLDYNFMPANIELFRGKRKEKDNWQTCLIPGGYPKLDYTIRRYSYLKKTTKICEDSILYAPTMTLLGDVWDENAASAVVGYEYQIICFLLDNFDENIIFRPHPNNYQYWRYYIEILKEKFKKNKRVIFNLTSNYMKSYLRAKFLITDVSDTAYTFSFSTLKPSIYFIQNEINRPCVWEDNVKMIGAKCSTLKELKGICNDMLESSIKWRDTILEFRDSHIFNIGKSEDYLIENLNYILESKFHPEWVYL